MTVVTQGPSAAAVRAQKAKVAAATEAYQAAVQRETQDQLVAHVTVSPRQGASDVALDDPVSVTAGLGTLTTVLVRDAAGQELTRDLERPAHAMGRSPGPWSHRRPTTWMPLSSARPAVSTKIATGFTTLTPAAPVTATAYPATGSVVGVGQPIVIDFDQNISSAAEQTVLSHLTVTESKPVPGGWHWFSPTELHFRPETFWPAGERVTISGNLEGWYAGNGMWGSGQISESFSVGDARISYANLATDEMTVTLNGQTIATYPISGGRPEYPTMNGIHIVLDKEPVVHMVSSTVGIPVNSAQRLRRVRIQRCAHLRQRGVRARRSLVGVRPGQRERIPRLHQPRSQQLPGLLQLQRDGRCRGGDRKPPATGPRRSRDDGLVHPLERVDARPGRERGAPATTTTTTVTPAVAANATSTAAGATPSTSTKAEPSPATSW